MMSIRRVVWRSTLVTNENMYSKPGKITSTRAVRFNQTTQLGGQRRTGDLRKNTYIWKWIARSGLTRVCALSELYEKNNVKKSFVIENGCLTDRRLNLLDILRGEEDEKMSIIMTIEQFKNTNSEKIKKNISSKHPGSLSNYGSVSSRYAK